jgi:hypothetical protein
MYFKSQYNLHLHLWSVDREFVHNNILYHYVLIIVISNNVLVLKYIQFQHIIRLLVGMLVTL